ncbi:MAG TPA: DUF5655 domain-containing protein [Flavisolibacter sp.]
MTMSQDTEPDIAAFFRGHEQAFVLFRRLRRVIEGVCSPAIAVSRTQVSFGEAYKYIWVWMPQLWVHSRPEGSIVLTILTGKKIKSPRITESVQPGTGFWTHHILIEKESEIDEEVTDLVRASYAFYLQRLEEKIRRKPAKKGPGKLR